MEARRDDNPTRLSNCKIYILKIATPRIVQPRVEQNVAAIPWEIGERLFQTWRGEKYNHFCTLLHSSHERSYRGQQTLPTQRTKEVFLEDKVLDTISPEAGSKARHIRVKQQHCGSTWVHLQHCSE
ncbi:Uncharacterized protein HZ326_21418 [Fusarium oxysporum f. sp. albedinis]|nr:Uncharacterized protein HZ326_21418 [Fusarium oxysporum f. sp. albedinis]